MAIRVICPKCKTPQEVPDAAAGKLAECTGCKVKFPVPGKKTCSRCGKDISHAQRSKDQYGRYYCVDCIQKVPKPTAEERKAKAAAVSATPGNKPAPDDELALHPPGAHVAPPPKPAAPAPAAPPKRAVSGPQPVPVAQTKPAEPAKPAAVAAQVKPAPPKLAAPAAPAKPAASTAAPAEAPAAPVAPAEPAWDAAQGVFRPLKSIQWPRLCVSCCAENPTQAIGLNVKRATEKRGAAMIVNVVTRILRKKAPSVPDEAAEYDVPVCDKCAALLSPDDIAGLNGERDAVLPEPFGVVTPFLLREISRKCVVVGFRNEKYATAFARANKGLIFDSVEACLAAEAQAKAEAAAPAAPAAVEPKAPAAKAAPATDERRLAPGDVTPPVLPAVTAAAIADVEDGNSLEAVEEEEEPAAPAAKPAAPPAPPPSAAKPAPAPKPAPRPEAKAPAPIPPPVPAPAPAPAKAEAPKKPPAPAAAGKPALASIAPEGLADELPEVLDVAPVPAKRQQTAFVPVVSAPPPRVARTAPVEERVLELLQSYPPQDDLSVTPDIAPEALAAISHSCAVPDSECVLAIVDCTAAKTAKHGVAFGCKGIYFSNEAGSSFAGFGSIPYEDMARRQFGDGAANVIALGHDQSLNVAGCAAGAAKVVALLKAVQECVAPPKRSAPSASAPPPPQAWRPQEGAESDILRQLAKTHLPDGPVKALAAGYWDTERLSAKLTGFLGKKAPETAPKEHHAGVIAVIGDKFYLADLGTITGEDLTLEKLKDMGPARVKDFRLRGLTVESSQSDTAGALQLGGAITLKATLPASCGADNPAKVTEIVTAIRCA